MVIYKCYIPGNVIYYQQNIPLVTVSLLFRLSCLVGLFQRAFEKLGIIAGFNSQAMNDNRELGKGATSKKSVINGKF